MSQRAFTLIELMVVVAIVSILATLSIGMSGDFRKGNAVNETAREIYNGLNRGRAEAIRRGLQVVIEINNDRMSAYVDSNYDETFQTGETLVYQYPKAPAVFAPGIVIDRAPLVTANTKPIVIFDYQGFSLDIATNPLSVSFPVSNPAIGATRRIDLAISGAVRVK